MSKYNFYWNKYLKDLGCNRNNIDPTKFSRSSKTKKLKEKTGIDYRECYNLDMSIAVYIYSRLSLYKDHTITDLRYEEKDYGDYHGFLDDAINVVLTGLRLYIRQSDTEKYLKKCQKYLDLETRPDFFQYTAAELSYKKAMNMFANIAPYLWD
jgi:hypothetical protein